jgi:hypothetical protein
MKSVRRLVAIGLLLGCGTPAHAQFFVPRPPIVPLGGFGVGFNYHHHHLALSGFYGRRYFGYPGFGYPGFGYPGFGYPRFGFGYPGWGYSMANVTYIYSPPPPVVIAPPIIINNNINVNPGNGAGEEREAHGPNPLDDDRFLKIMPRKRRRAEAVPVPPLPGQPAGRFRPIDPQERIRPEAPKKAAKPAEMPKKPPIPERPADNPRDENARLQALARQAFAAGEFGRAERRLQQAVRTTPDEPLTYFLLAQAQIALGQFREAVDSIDEGTRRKPGWPGERFRVRDLYNGNDDDFADHRHRLEETLERHPNDFFLLFLRGYQLWFDGKQADARRVFEQALKAAPPKYKPLVNRFLFHGMPIARGE